MTPGRYALRNTHRSSAVSENRNYLGSDMDVPAPFSELGD